MLHQELTGKDMLQIDMANTFGLDKAEFVERLIWAELHEDELEELAQKADERYMYEKAVRAWRATQAGIPVGHNMFLDATASGYQMMAALSGCIITGINVNMVFNGTRNDLYAKMATTMNTILPEDADRVDRDKVKHPTMTTAYNSKKQPEDIFGVDTPELFAFHDTLRAEVPGAMLVMDVINKYWDNLALCNTWTLPDGHTARVLVTDVVTARVEVDELDHTTFSHRFKANKPSEYGVSLVANIVQSVESYVVREMIHRADKAGFELAHIFDAFCAHPNYMAQVAQFYREIMAEIARSNLLADILSEISGKKVYFLKLSTDLDKYIMKSQYMLS